LRKLTPWSSFTRRTAKSFKFGAKSLGNFGIVNFKVGGTEKTLGGCSRKENVAKTDKKTFIEGRKKMGKG